MRHRSVTVPVILATLVLLSGCNQEPGPAAVNPPAVDVARVILQPVTAWDSFNGRISALESVAILPRVGGYITRVAFKEGGEVKTGDLLFVVDQRPYRAALESARAQLEGAHAALRFAARQDQRARQLLLSSAVSKEEADQKSSAHEQRLAELHAAEAAVSSANLNLEFTEVRAPVDGRTGRAQLTSGNMAVADQTVLTSVVTQDPVYVYFDPDEQRFLDYQKRLKTTQSAKVRIGLATDEGFPYEGELDFVDNQIDPATGTIRVRATVRNPQRLLTPGAYARVELSIGEPALAVLIPERAVLTDQDKKYVYVLMPDNTAEKRYVRAGVLIGSQRVISSGLAESDSVIVSGLQQIYASGTLVSPSELPTDKPELNVSSAVEFRK